MDAPAATDRATFLTTWTPQLWREFTKGYTGHRTADHEGCRWTCAGVMLSFLNAGFLTSAVTDTDDLRQRTEWLLQQAGATGKPFLILLDRAHLAGVDPAVLQDFGLQHVETLTGMVADQLTEPVRTVPSLEVRFARERHLQEQIGVLNSRAYGMPEEWGIEAVAGDPDFWTGDVHAAASLLDRQLVSCAVTARYPEGLYVMWVATALDHRGKGYAETVMRRSIEQAQPRPGEPIWLHASTMGRPLYERMGFRPLQEVLLYAPGH